MAARPDQIVPGSRWLHELLGSQAIYEVIADDGELVDVRVERAPGLAPGTRIRLTRAAVTAMRPLPPRRRGA